MAELGKSFSLLSDIRSDNQQSCVRPMTFVSVLQFLWNRIMNLKKTPKTNAYFSFQCIFAVIGEECVVMGPWSLQTKNEWANLKNNGPWYHIKMLKWVYIKVWIRLILKSPLVTILTGNKRRREYNFGQNSNSIAIPCYLYTTGYLSDFSECWNIVNLCRSWIDNLKKEDF